MTGDLEQHLTDIRDFFYTLYGSSQVFVKKASGNKRLESAVKLKDDLILIEFVKSVIPAFVITKDGKYPIFEQISGNDMAMVKSFKTLIEKYDGKALYHEIFKGAESVFGPVFFFSKFNTQNYTSQS